MDLWDPCRAAAKAKTPRVRYQQLLTEAIVGRSRVRRLAANPVMLTCLCVVHWNEGRLPEGRSRVYRAALADRLAQRAVRGRRLYRSAAREALDRTLAIFEPEGASRVPVETRIAAAEALGRGGDPRLAPGTDAERLLEVPGLDGRRLGKYPVTVEDISGSSRRGATRRASIGLRRVGARRRREAGKALMSGPSSSITRTGRWWGFRGTRRTPTAAGSAGSGVSRSDCRRTRSGNWRRRLNLASILGGKLSRTRSGRTSKEMLTRRPRSGSIP